MTRRGRTLGALLAAGALLLSGCEVTTDAEQTQPTEQSQRESEDAGGAPGDLLPSAPESGTPGPGTTGSATTDPGATEPDGTPSPQDTTGPGNDEATDPPTAPGPTDGEGAEPELGGPGIPACDLLDLPATTLDTIEDIEAGGPYEFPRNDGVTFQNREGILPDESHDYYREFTVVTPNLDHRGARRIVTGGGAETDPDHWYFTGDHYESFCEFDPDRG